MSDTKLHYTSLLLKPSWNRRYLNLGTFNVFLLLSMSRGDRCILDKLETLTLLFTYQSAVNGGWCLLEGDHNNKHENECRYILILTYIFDSLYSRWFVAVHIEAYGLSFALHSEIENLNSESVQIVSKFNIVSQNLIKIFS